MDIVSFSSQHFLSKLDSAGNKIYIQDNFLNFFAPINFGKGNVLLLRLNTERLSVSTYDSVRTTKALYSIATPFGLQLASKSQLWKYTTVIIPKLNTDFNGKLDQDFQLGAYFIVTRIVNKDLTLRLGIYYNKECFGDFWLPLVGADWKINDKVQVYGTLPSSLRVEYKLNKHWNIGLNFRAFLRSYRLNANNANDYIWARENQIKFYLERFIYKNIVFSVDIFRSLTYSLSKYESRIQKDDKPEVPIPDRFAKNYGITIGFAYRIMR